MRTIIEPHEYWDAELRLNYEAHSKSRLRGFTSVPTLHPFGVRL